MLYFPQAILVFRETVSVAVIGTLILIVLCIIASIFVMRIYMTQSKAFVVGGVATGSIIAGECVRWFLLFVDVLCWFHSDKLCISLRFGAFSQELL